MIDINELKKEIGEKLKTAREEKNMSQEELAKMLGLSKVGYGALERGKNLIGLQHLIALTYILEKPITNFLPAHVVSNTEHNDPLLDPTFQEILESWPLIPAVNQRLARDIVVALARKAAEMNSR